MKTTALFNLLLSVLFGLAIMTPQSSIARDYRKTLPDCVTCKMPVYSYYRFKTYENHQAIYSWQISGHSKCGIEPTVVKPVAAKQEDVDPTAEVKMASAKSAVNPSQKTQTDKKGKTAGPKSESEELAYSRPVQPTAYGGGSGYVSQGAYGGPVYGGGHQCHSVCNHGGSYGHVQRRGYGYGYGTGTVKRSVTVTRSTPSTTMYGSFPGSSTRTYSTRTRVTRRGGYGGYWGGGGYGFNVGFGYRR